METFHRSIPLLTILLTSGSLGWTSSVAAVSRPCVGDCNRDGQVTVDELVVGVNVGLGRQPLADCTELDGNGDGLIAIDDIVSAVRDTLDACVFPAVSVDQSGDPIVIATALFRAELDRAPLRLAFYEGPGRLQANTEPLTREATDEGFFYERSDMRYSLGNVLGATPIRRGLQLAVATSEGSPATVRVRFLSEKTVQVEVEPPSPETLTKLGDRWHSPPDELIYGLTERLRDSPPLSPGLEIPRDDAIPPEAGSLNRRGETVEMFIRPTFSLYAPFYQSSRGYGLLVGGTMPGEYDLASSVPDVVRFEFETGTRRENQRLTYFVFLGPDHPTILDEYTNLTGRPFVPPDWAFLNWRWRGELAMGAPAELDGVPVNAQLAEDVHMFEALEIPPGVYLFDRPVLPGNFGFARFEWDEERLPNPESMLDSLRQRGYELAMWSSTWLCGSDPGDNGIEGQELGFTAPGDDDAPPFCDDLRGTNFIMDVTDPDARVWFRDKLAAFLARYGIRAIKLDRGEEHIPSETTDIWADGRTGREVHNDYVRIQTKVHRDALAEAFPDGNFTVLTRSGYTGTQKDSLFWGGDIPGSELFGSGMGTDLGLRSAIISQQRAAFMGFPVWGSDTGGYYEFKDRDVFARWIEFSCFSGIMEIGGVGSHAPWDMPTEPSFDMEMIGIYRRYASLRQQLLPYIIEAARQAGRSGLPIVRPLSFLDRTDPELEDRWDEYLFGPDLLVAPIWRVGQRSRRVYFPAGAWRSLWNESERFQGPATVELEAPLDTILTFIRGDAPSPLGSAAD